LAKKPPSPARGPDTARKDTARKIWLAGIGAYGKAFTEAQESLAKMTDGSSRRFDELVSKGEEIEDAVEAKGRALASQVKTPSFSIDDRIKKMRARLKLGEEGGEDRLSAIEARLGAIEEKLDALLAQSGAQGASKPAKKKARKKTPTAKQRSS